MVLQGLFIPNDPYHQHSFVTMFLPMLQAIVNEYVGIWNHHDVHYINENGRYRESYVPTHYFQEFECL
jgi:hypothetical protein